MSIPHYIPMQYVPPYQAIQGVSQSFPQGSQSFPQGSQSFPQGSQSFPQGSQVFPQMVSQVFPQMVSHQYMQYQTQPIQQTFPYGLPQAPNGLPQAPNGLPQAPNGLPQAPNGLPQAPNGFSQNLPQEILAQFNNEEPPQILLPIYKLKLMQPGNIPIYGIEVVKASEIITQVFNPVDLSQYIQNIVTFMNLNAMYTQQNSEQNT